MKNIGDYVYQIQDLSKRTKVNDLFSWIFLEFPELDSRIAWNQPMFTHHETYIIGFSMSLKHLAVAPEKQTLDFFQDEITLAGYESTKMLFKMSFDKPFNLALLKKIISYNIIDKKDCNTFWRKP